MLSADAEILNVFQNLQRKLNVGHCYILYAIVILRRYSMCRAVARKLQQRGPKIKRGRAHF